jgi:hypothetical protein
MPNNRSFKAANLSAGCLNTVTYAHPQLVIIRILVYFLNAPKLLTKQRVPSNKKITELRSCKRKWKKYQRKTLMQNKERISKG